MEETKPATDTPDRCKAAVVEGHSARLEAAA